VALSPTTVTPKPPLNIFEAVRKNLSGNAADWQQLVEVPKFSIPANGPVAAKTVNTAAIITGLIITNTHTATIRASARIKDASGANTYYPILNAAIIPPNDFLTIGFERQVLLTGEKLEVVADGGTATAHFTYIVNQREDFEVIA
jgi:hypothetical protein